MEDKLIYGKVDDMVFDLTYAYIKGLIKSVRVYHSNSIKQIPEAKIHEWRDKLWKKNVHKFDQNNLYEILESLTYELREEIINYLAD